MLSISVQIRGLRDGGEGEGLGRSGTEWEGVDGKSGKRVLRRSKRAKSREERKRKREYVVAARRSFEVLCIVTG